MRLFETFVERGGTRRARDAGLTIELPAGARPVLESYPSESNALDFPSACLNLTRGKRGQRAALQICGWLGRLPA